MQLFGRGRQSQGGGSRSLVDRRTLKWSLFDSGITLDAETAWLEGWRLKARLLVFAVTALLIVIHLETLDRALRLIVWVFFAPLAY